MPVWKDSDGDWKLIAWVLMGFLLGLAIALPLAIIYQSYWPFAIACLLILLALGHRKLHWLIDIFTFWPW